jgi:hypothetical protein
MWDLPDSRYRLLARDWETRRFDSHDRNNFARVRRCHPEGEVPSLAMRDDDKWSMFIHKCVVSRLCRVICCGPPGSGLFHELIKGGGWEKRP